MTLIQHLVSNPTWLSLQIDCDSLGSPDPETKWFKNGSPLKTGLFASSSQGGPDEAGGHLGPELGVAALERKHDATVPVQGHDNEGVNGRIEGKVLQ